MVWTMVQITWSLEPVAPPSLTFSDSWMWAAHIRGLNFDFDQRSRGPPNLFSFPDAILWPWAREVGAGLNILFFLSSPKDILIDFRDEGKEKERERNIDCLLYAPQVGTEPETPTCALTGNQTFNVLICGMMPNHPSHTGQGESQLHYLKIFYFFKV